MGIRELLLSLDDFDVFVDDRNGLSPAAIEALEAELDREFPRDFRRFLEQLGCGAVVAPDVGRAEERARARGGEWGVELYGGRARGYLPPGLDIRVRFAESQRRGRPGAPLLGILGGRAQLVATDRGLAWVGTRGGCGGRIECGVPEPAGDDFVEVLNEVITRLREEMRRRVGAPGASNIASAVIGH